MNTTHYKQGSQTRYPRWSHFLAALFVAAMVMILTVPAFAVEATASTSTPGTEVSVPTSDLVENSADEDGAYPDEAVDSEPLPTPTCGPVSTMEELLDAIAHANENDVIELDAYIQTPPELVLGRADCPITIRRISSEGRFILGDAGTGSIKVQNITFDGAGIQAVYPFISTDSPKQVFEKCNFVNCVAEIGGALFITNGETLISDCHFSNNIGLSGAHLRLGSRKATVENCTFTDGYASTEGSITLAPMEEAFLTGCTISGNAAGKRGGGVFVGAGKVVIAGCKIYGNTVNGVADDITQNYWGRLFLVDDYAALVELYKPDGVIPNRWTVDNCISSTYMEETDYTDMIFSMTFADNEPSPPPPSSPTPTSVTLDKSELTLDVGETGTLSATLHPEGTSSSVQWTSSDPSVASITESGFITAHSTGTTVITATAAVGRASASCLITVQEAPATTYSISISASPVEGGTVSGEGQYEEGATATATAVPNEGFRFLAWTEADTQISTEASLTFPVTNDRTLTAIFEPISKPTPGPISKPIYTITTSATEGGTVSGAGKYEAGSSVTLTATTESGYLFIAWTENNELISFDESFTFIADCDRTIAATFARTYTINISVAVGGTVSIGATEEGISNGFGGEFLKGSPMTYTAIPDSGYLFTGWTENGEQVSDDECITFVVDRDRALVANFTPIPKPIYTIKTSATVGGTASGGGEYEQGSSVTLTAIPESEYLFIGWTENGEQVNTDENFTFIAEQGRTLVANFEPIPKPTYTVQVNSTQSGVAEGGGSYEEGEFITVNAVPGAGYRFLRWEENGVQVSTEARYSFAVEADRTLVAIFELIPQSPPNLTHKPSQGTGTPSTLHSPGGGKTQPVTVSVASLKEVQIPTLTNEKAVLIAPDDSFWIGYKAGRDNGMGTVTRADLAQLLYSMMNSKSTKTYGVAQAPFRDVESGMWYEAAVGTMLNAGIMVGCGDNLFCPDRTLTWGELLTAFARFTEDKPPTEYYTGEHWAKNAVNKAFTLGWLEYSEMFNPGSIVTTSEMVDLIQAVFRWSNE